MLSRKKSKNLLLKNNIINRPIAIIVSIVICLSSIIGALIAPISVLAWSATGLQTTIASIIMSLLLSTGTAPVNSTWVNTLNSAYGVESSFGTIADCIESGLLTETSAGLVDTGLSAAIEATSEYSSLGLSEIFTTTASDVGVTVASGGANIATTVIEVGTAGTIAAFAGAAITGVGAGVLINHVREKFVDYIKYGLPLSRSDINNIISNVPSGYNDCYYSVYSFRGTVYSNFYFAPANSHCIAYRSTTGIYSNIYDDSGNFINPIYYKRYTNGTLTEENPNLSNSGPSWNTSNTVTIDHSNVPIFESLQAKNNYINSIKAGQSEFQETAYPDIVTPNGNAYIYGSDGTDYINGAQPTVPDGYTISPVDMDDYLNFMNDANQNTEDGNTDEETQGQLFNDLVNPLLNEPAEPEQPVNPSDPTHPANPEQPNIPDKPDISDTDLEESLNLATTPELKEVFPFCIPWDIVDCLLLFRVTEREAPFIQFTMIDGNQITLDFSIFDSVASLLRILELISFIIGLAIATRYIIGAT